MVVFTDLPPHMQQLAFEEADMILRTLIEANKPLFAAVGKERGSAIEFTAIASALVKLLYLEVRSETKDHSLTLQDFQPEMDEIWQVVRKSLQKRVRHLKTGELN